MNVINFECRKTLSCVDSYLSNELATETAQEVAAHLEHCASCSEALQARAHVKNKLKEAVLRTEAPADLQNRIRKSIRQSSTARWTTWALAAAAAVVVAFGSWGVFQALRSSAPSQPPGQAGVGGQQPVDYSARVLKVGLDDHVYCAIDHGLANREFTSEQMSEKLGAEYSGLVSLVKEKMPRDYAVVVGHRCHLGGREFIHLILRNQQNAVSLVLTRKQGEAFPENALGAAMRAAGVPLFEARMENLEVSGFETRDHLAFVVSSQTREDNLQLASAIAPAVREFLAKMEDAA